MPFASPLAPLALFAADPPRWERFAFLLPVVLGGLAVYWLLPGPGRRSPLAGAAAGVLALLAAGGLLVRAKYFGVEALLFYSFAALALASGTLVVTQRHPARAALSFTLVVLSTCGLFLLLAAPFLMAATIIVYAGAIVVTFLFVIMLAQQEGLDSADARSREPLLVTLTGFLLLAAILYVLQGYRKADDYDALIAEVESIRGEGSAEQMAGRVGEPEADNFLFRRAGKLANDGDEGEVTRMIREADTDWAIARSPLDPEGGMPRPTERTSLRKLRDALLAGRERLTTAPLPQPVDGAAAVPLSPLSGTPAGTPPGEVRRDARTLVPELPADNSAYLGRSLFTDFLLPVELGGTLLLVATVGAIAIAQKRVEGADRSDVAPPPPGGTRA